MADNNQSFDIFISYARKDNLDGSITRFINTLSKRYEETFPTSKLTIFFDKENIHTGDDWNHRLKSALKTSKVMLAFLSENYIASEWCQKEWYLWCDLERSRGLLENLLNPIYYSSIFKIEESTTKIDTSNIPSFPLLNSKESDEESNLDDFFSRQHIDLRDWEGTGKKRYVKKATYKIIDNFLHILHSQILKVLNTELGETDFIKNNKNFCGRLAEIKTIKAHFAEEKGIIPIIHGLAGEGKTALAIAYAHAYAYNYTGGRYLVSCGGMQSLMQCFCKLGEDLGFVFSQENTESANFKQVWDFLINRPGASSLVILDNIDNQELLSMQSLNSISKSTDKVHILITTPCRCDALTDTIKTISLQNLSQRDALLLMSTFRPYKNEEIQYVRKIINSLGGHALSLNLLGAFLKLHERITYAILANKLEKISGIDILNQTTEISSAIDYKYFTQIEQLVLPTIESFSKEENTALELISLLAPDTIPSIWIEETLFELYPSLNDSILLTSPTEKILRKLVAYNLIQEKDSHDFNLDEDLFSQKSIVYYQSHSLVRGVIQKTIQKNSSSEELYSALFSVVTKAVENQMAGYPTWPLSALLSLLSHFETWLKEMTNPEIVLPLAEKLISKAIRGSGNTMDSISLVNKLLCIIEKLPQNLENKLTKAQYYTCRGQIYSDLANKDLALLDFQYALTLFEESANEEINTSFKVQHIHLLDYLGELKRETGNFDEAISLHKKALELLESEISKDKNSLEINSEKSYTLEHLGKAYQLNKEQDKAKTCFEEAFNHRKNISSLDTTENHLYKRNLALSYENLGNISFYEDSQNTFENFKMCKEIRKNLYLKDPTNIIIKRDLAVIYSRLGDYFIYKQQPSDALDSFEKSLVLREEILNNDKENLLLINDLTKCLIKKGSALEALEDFEKANNYYTVAYNEREKLYLSSPGSLEYLRGYIFILYTYAQYYKKINNEEKELTFLHLLVKNIHEITNRSSVNSQEKDLWRKELESLENRVCFK